MSRYPACFFIPPGKTFPQQYSLTQPGRAFSNTLAASSQHYPSARFYPPFQSPYFPTQYPWAIANHRPFLNSPTFNSYYETAPGSKYIPSVPSYPYSFNPVTAAARQPVICTLPYSPLFSSIATEPGAGTPRGKTNPASVSDKMMVGNSMENNFLHHRTPQELEGGNIDIPSDHSQMCTIINFVIIRTTKSVNQTK